MGARDRKLLAGSREAGQLEGGRRARERGGIVAVGSETAGE